MQRRTAKQPPACFCMMEDCVKKRIIRMGIAAAILICAALMTGLPAKPKKLEAIAPAQERDFMHAALTYDEGLRTLRGTQTWIARNRTGSDLDEIVLRLYMNGWDGCSVHLSGVTVDGVGVSCTQDADDPTLLTIAYPWRAGEEIALEWTVMLKHGKQDGVPVILLPSLAMYEGGEWRKDAYDDLADPSYAQPFDFVTLLDGEVVARARMARDACFAMGAVTREKDYSGVRIRAIAQDAATAKLMASAS